MIAAVLPRLAQEARRHQAGLLLDTNVLLLYLALKTSSELADEWKKTEAFNADHARMLAALVASAHRLVTTPHILTEASDLADHGLPRRWREPFRATLRAFMLHTRERSVEARRVAADDDVLRIGLADLAQAFFSWHSRPLVVTTDLDVWAALEKRKLPVINLNHDVF